MNAFTSSICVVALAGCSISARIAPAVTVDPSGRVGAQLLVGFGFVLGGQSRNEKALAGSVDFGVEVGAMKNGGDAHDGAIIGEYFDYRKLPKLEGGELVEGVMARIGLRLAIRPTWFSSVGYRTVGGVGVAGGLGYRLLRGAGERRLVHYVGVEARCDSLFGLSDDPPPPVAWTCAAGPHYEIVKPLLEYIPRM